MYLMNESHSERNERRQRANEMADREYERLMAWGASEEEALEAAEEKFNQEF